jgi:hypothetical protein
LASPTEMVATLRPVPLSSPDRGNR